LRKKRSQDRHWKSKFPPCRKKRDKGGATCDKGGANG
jgi:hypothetical protein